MKFTVDKNLLQSAITTASRASAAKSSVPALEGLLIEAAENGVKISGYDLKTGITTSVPADVIGEGAIVLNSRLFNEIIRKLPDNIVAVSSDGSLMTKIESGLSEFQILGTPAVDYPELPPVDYKSTVSISERKLKSMITQTNFAVSGNEARPVLTGALFEIEKSLLTIVACDGFRIALRREELTKTDTDNLCFVVPGAALGEVEKILGDNDNPVSIMLGSKHIMFVISGTVLIARRLEGDFLKYKNHFQSIDKYSFEADRRLFMEAVERVSLIINDKLKCPVRCTFSDGVVRFLSSTALGRATDECPVKGFCNDLEIGFNNRYLLDALKAAQSDRICIQITSGLSPCLIVPADDSRNFIYLILPVRLTANDS